MSRVIRMQVMAGVLGCLALLVFANVVYAMSYVYGVVMMAMNAWWLARKLDDIHPDTGQGTLIAGAALRFVTLVVGLLIGQWLGLHLLLVAVGIFVAQLLVYVVALYGLSKEHTEVE